MRGTGARLVVVALVGCLTACTSSSSPAPGPTPSPTSTPSLDGQTPSRSTAPETTRDTSTGTIGPTESRVTSPELPEPPEFRAAAAMRTVRRLAVEIGPREASSTSYRRAADWVAQAFAANGYRVRRPAVPVPAGNSWGIDVPAGMTTNVLATAPGFDPTAPHVVVSAHLDTVPQAPGAEDDASGIGVLLELSRLADVRGTRLPVVFVAFGGEEPRGGGDLLHHFGSRAMVARMPSTQRQAMVGMVSMDRVGVGTVVPVCTGGQEPSVVRGQLLRAGQRAGVPTSACENTSSDHWSFELAGMPAARVGGTSYAGYHSAADLPSVINLPQLRRVGVLMWVWMEQR